VPQQAVLANKVKTMYTRKIENGLALLAALIVLFAVSAAANIALADDAGTMGPDLKTEASTTN
jgi:hypothetical protein